MKYISILIWFSLIGFSQNNSLVIYMDTIQAEPNTNVLTNVYSDNFLNLISFQGTIEFNPEILSYVTSFSDNLAINFGETETSQGILTYSWYDGSLN